MAKPAKLNDQEIETEIQRLVATVDELRVEHDAITNKLQAQFDRMNKLKKERVERLVRAGMKTGIRPWADLLAYEPGEPNYEWLNHVMTKASPNHHVHQSGCNQDIMQYRLAIFCSADSHAELPAMEKLILEILPVLKFHEGKVTFEIKHPYDFTVMLEWDGATWTLVKSRYSRHHEKVFTSIHLKMILAYVQENYNSGRYDDEDEQ